MTGYHEVKVFVFKGEGPHLMPDGWKPFACEYDDNRMFVTARRWHRRDKS